jgi:phosphoserine phosphatase
MAARTRRRDESRRDPLCSWARGPAKAAIIEFVTRVTSRGGPDFVPEPERVAVFDNDGTLWAERPVMFELCFALDRLSSLASRSPVMKAQQPFKAFVERDLQTIASFTKREAFEFAFATHAGMTTAQFAQIATAWLMSAMHPQLSRRFTDCAYQPQVELVAYLRAAGFKTYIVTGGGIDFVRCFAERVYGIPPEHVIGSSNRTALEMRDGTPVLWKLAEIRSFDDRDEKVVNFDLHTGRRPILAFGNSDGDLPMLRYTGTAGGPRMRLLLHHDDEEREFAYDRDFGLSPLDHALHVAPEEGITVVSMRHDWGCVFRSL